MPSSSIFAEAEGRADHGFVPLTVAGGFSLSIDHPRNLFAHDWAWAGPIECTDPDNSRSAISPRISYHSIGRRRSRHNGRCPSSGATIAHRIEDDGRPFFVGEDRIEKSSSSSFFGGGPLEHVRHAAREIAG